MLTRDLFAVANLLVWFDSTETQSFDMECIKYLETTLLTFFQTVKNVSGMFLATMNIMPQWAARIVT